MNKIIFWAIVAMSYFYIKSNIINSNTEPLIDNTPALTAESKNLFNDKSKYINEEQLQCLADNIYHEARGEPVLGQIAVGQVTLNRSYSRNMSICEVVYEGSKRKTGCQFSWTCTLKNYSIKEINIYKEIRQLSINLLNGNYPDPTEGSSFYHATTITPYWAKSTELSAKVIIGQHKFYQYKNE